jgi:hypothetical protein
MAAIQLPQTRPASRAHCARSEVTCPAKSEMITARQHAVREESDEQRRDPECRLRLCCHHSAKSDGRQRDTDLGAGKWHANESQHSAKCHHYRERDRQQPDRGRAELRAPQSDRNHRHDVVQSRYRMHKTAREPATLVAR